MNFEEFRKSTLKVKGKRYHKIKGSIGVKDMFKIAAKAQWYGKEFPMSLSEYFKIVREMNKLLAQELIEGRDVTLPCKMGMLEVRKYPTYVKFENGKIKTNRAVDWNATLKLWHEDAEAREDKILVRSEKSHVFTIFYNTYPANYNNKHYYHFIPTREVSLAVKKAGIEGKIDAYNLNKNG